MGDVHSGRIGTRVPYTKRNFMNKLETLMQLLRRLAAALDTIAVTTKRAAVRNTESTKTNMYPRGHLVT